MCFAIPPATCSWVKISDCLLSLLCSTYLKVLDCLKLCILDLQIHFTSLIVNVDTVNDSLLDAQFFFNK